MRDKLLSECALFDLQRASRVIGSLYNAHLRGAGMTIAQWSLLRNVAALAPVSIGRLAEALAMERTSVTRLVEPLIELGWVRRFPGDDRRVRNLQVTARGRARIRAGLAHWRAAQRELMGRLGEARWRLMRDSLRSAVRLVRRTEARP
jgi:DNA-binding MarR family transcriptional regulator